MRFLFVCLSFYPVRNLFFFEYRRKNVRPLHFSFDYTLKISSSVFLCFGNLILLPLYTPSPIVVNTILYPYFNTFLLPFTIILLYFPNYALEKRLLRPNHAKNRLISFVIISLPWHTASTKMRCRYSDNAKNYVSADYRLYVIVFCHICIEKGRRGKLPRRPLKLK